LQHGIIINDGKWLYYEVTKFKMFTCGARPEYEFVKEKFHYPDGIVKYLGLCRFDGLHDVKVNKKQILFMPTWRNWLVRETIGTNFRKLNKSFVQSEFFINWMNLLNDSNLNTFLEENNIKLIFFPHRNMQIFLDSFLSRLNDHSQNIIIPSPNDYDLQLLLKESAVLVTDYSSVFFDFAYMNKPVIFFQFDEDEFRRKQYSEGYFDYHKNPLGEWVGDADSVVSAIIEKEAGGFATVDNVTEFFELYDKKNCERNYLAVKGIL
jgi:CDP-glycerol glycerophosphotransferase (TagB/SpsB family)